MNVVYFTRNKVRSVFSIPPARIPYMDVTIVLAGVMRYSLNGERIELHGGDAIVFQEGDVREREAGGAAEYYSFNVTPEKECRLPFFRGKITDCVNDEILSILRLYEGCYGMFSSRSGEKGNHCFLMLYFALHEKFSESKPDNHVARIKRCIADHINDPIGLADISAEVFLSPNYCNYIFKSHTGSTITEFVIKVKMERAKQLLLNTAMPLPEIAYSLGYKQYSYFSRLFKKEVGVSPASFRKTWMYSEEDEIEKENAKNAVTGGDKQ